MDHEKLIETLVDQFVRRLVIDVVRQRTAGKIVMTFTVWCASCDNHISPKSDTKGWAMAQAKQAGWKEKRHKGWLCPSCLSMKVLPNEPIQRGKPLPMPQDMLDQLAELDAEEDECTCLRGDNFCPVHNADYARYIRS